MMGPRRSAARHLPPALPAALACAALLVAADASAQGNAPAQPAAAAPVAATPPSDSAMVNLVRLLVEQGVLTPDKGEALMRQAQVEAAQVRAAAGQPPAGQPGAATPAAPPAQLAVQPADDLPPPPAGTVRVPYVPDSVRAQIRDELRSDVLAQAKAEGWAAPGKAAPSWVDRFRISGDVRFRSASVFNDRGNSNQIIDVFAWNATGPYDTLAPAFVVPTLNATEDRVNTGQIRARLNLEATIAQHFQVGLQIATGDDPGPISTDASLGGGFRKRDLWLQNAYLRGEPVRGLTLMVGRFDNPLRTTDMLFDPDLALDGVYGELDFGKLFERDYSVAIRGGAFPIDFGDPNYPVTSIDKRDFPDRYLFSAQLEASKTFGSAVNVRAAVAYHSFTNLRGRVSEPCDIYSSDRVECSTDALRPLFASKGNTWSYLRRFDLTNQQPGDPLSEPQFLGYKFGFRVLDVNASVNVALNDRITARLTGGFLHNFAFDRDSVCADGFYGQPQNNVNDPSGVCNAGSTGRFVGGPNAYGGYFYLGSPSLFGLNLRYAERGQWALKAAYKWLESDAAPDSFVDSDFHLGGTNAKGYMLGATYAFLDNMTIGARWLSANEIVDQPLGIDLLQLDLTVGF